jgi:hypothetical protein
MKTRVSGVPYKVEMPEPPMGLSSVGFHSVFAMPILQFKFSKHSSYFFEDIPKSVNKPSTWTQELNTSFPNISDQDSFTKADVRDKLKEDLLQEINQALFSLNYKENLSFQHFWYNIYHQGQGQERHRHLGMFGERFCFLSGIYFNKNASTCQLNFHRDYGFHEIYDYEGFKGTSLEHFFWTKFHPGISDGDVLLFPPYLEHSVSPNENKENKMRVTFSFNLIKEGSE